MHIHKKVVSITLAATSITIGLVYQTQYATYAPIYKAPIIIEYGETNISKTDILENIPENEHVEIINIEHLDTTQQQPQQIRVETKKKLRTKVEEIAVEVQDTRAPLIQIVQDEIQIQPDDHFQIQDNIIDIKDPIDGSIENVQHGAMHEYDMFLNNRMRKLNCTFIGSDLDVKTPGAYEIKIVAYDMAGNCAKRSFFIHVENNTQARGMIHQEALVEDVQVKDQDEDSHVYYEQVLQTILPQSLETFTTYEEAYRAYLQLEFKEEWQITTLSTFESSDEEAYNQQYILVNIGKKEPSVEESIAISPLEDND